MKKFTNIFLAVLITLFSFPIGGLNVNAEGKTEEVNYIIKHATDDEASSADVFFEKPGILIEKAGKLYLQATIKSWSMVEALSSEGTEVTVISENDSKNIAKVEIELNEDLSTATNLQMTINVPGLYNTTHEARLFILDGNDSEEFNGDENGEGGSGDNSSGEGNDGGEGAENEGNENGDGTGEDPEDNGSNTRDDANLIKESEVESVEQIEPISSLRLSGYFETPFKLLNDNGKRYIQIKGRGMGNMLTSLTVDGEEVIWGEVKEDGTYTVQFEWEGALSNVSTLAMTIDTGRPDFGVMTHSGTLSFGKNYNLNDAIDVTGDEVILLDGVQLTAPKNIPNDVVLKVTEQTDIETPENLEQAGKIFDFNFENLNGNFDGFKLVMDYDADTYNDEEYDVDIYYYDEDKNEWVAQNGNAVNGIVTLEVDHFSTYGVFAQKKDNGNPSDKDDPKEDPKEDPKVVKYHIDYVVKHETKDEESAANAFFEKPGTLIERDGKTYLQTTITSWSMIKSLSYGDNKVKVISEDKDKDSAVVEFEITRDLTDVIMLTMKISVPGFYESEYDARLILDPSSKKLIEDGKGSGSGGQGGTPSTPGINTGNGKGTQTPKPTPEEKSDKVVADKAYKINYVVYKEDVNEPSAADQFFKKPGILLEKDGKKYLQITITSWSMIDYLNYNGKPVQVIKVDKSSDSALVQLQIDGKLSDVVNLNMQITVPGLYEGQEYDARLVLDPDSMSEIDSAGHYIYTGVAKPGDFGKAEGDKTGKTNPTANPKTGDTSQLMFFTLLLIGSLITLSIQIKRRLA